MLASQNNNNQKMLITNGTPLKKKLSKALFRSRLRAFGLVTPLLLLISIGFVFPIIVFLTRGVYNDTFEKYMVNLTPILAEWDGKSEPTEDMYEALVLDLVWLKETKNIGKVASRMNRELSGSRSLFTSSARKAKKLEAPFKESLTKVKKKWAKLETWRAMKVTSQSLSPVFLASALDMKYTAEGTVVQKSPERRIHVKLFIRTLEISLVVVIAGLNFGLPSSIPTS